MKDNKSKKSLILMNPLLVTIILLVIQLVVLLAMFVFLADYIKLLSGFWFFITLLLAVFIVNNNENPAYKMSWLLLMCFIPVFGVLLYLFIKLIPGTKNVVKLFLTKVEETRTHLPQNNDAYTHLQSTHKGYGNLARYMQEYGPYPVYENCHTTYYPLGEDAFKAMKEALSKAQHFIFMEYFIITPGVMWNEIQKILEEKAKAGVEVRLMYDGTLMFSLPAGFDKKLREKGIQCKVFAPVKPLLSTYQNNRDHRKMLIVDNAVAFTGGINLADEYINKIVKYGHWKDTALRVYGGAVRSFTLMFLQMWNISEASPGVHHAYIGEPPLKYENAKPHFVIPYGDAPADNEQHGEFAYLDIINNAENYVHIMTPYLILDNELLTSLCFAAKRGIDVVILLPHIADKEIPFCIARSYYPELLSAGVKIYEYKPGFIHAKSFVSDDIASIVGTINLDYRSLYLHYENAVFVYNEDFAKEVEKDFKETVEKSIPVDLAYYKALPLSKRFLGRVMRVFGPLM